MRALVGTGLIDENCQNLKGMVMYEPNSLTSLLNKKRALVVPGVFDALTSKIAQHCGFQAIYMSGYGTAASYGYPDFGLLTMTEMLENVRRITDAVDIPLIADADTGYGNPINVYRTVREYERAGAAAIQLEDQTWPKRCGHMEGKQVIEAEEMVGKVKAAVDARANPHTLLVIRTDAIATHGFEEAVLRGHLYVEAGADVLFIEAPANEEQLRQIPQLFSKPCLINMALPHPDLDVKALGEIGYRVALYPLVTLVGALDGCIRMCKSLLANGKMEDIGTWPFDLEGLNHFLGIENYRDIEERFASSLEKGGEKCVK
jgi:2,3-dimethylmalate lyase